MNVRKRRCRNFWDVIKYNLWSLSNRKKAVWSVVFDILLPAYSVAMMAIVVFAYCWERLCCLDLSKLWSWGWCPLLTLIGLYKAFRNVFFSGKDEKFFRIVPLRVESIVISSDDMKAGYYYAYGLSGKKECPSGCDWCCFSPRVNAYLRKEKTICVEVDEEWGRKVALGLRGREDAKSLLWYFLSKSNLDNKDFFNEDKVGLRTHFDKSFMDLKDPVVGVYKTCYYAGSLTNDRALDDISRQNTKSKIELGFSAFPWRDAGKDEKDKKELLRMDCARAVDAGCVCPTNQIGCSTLAFTDTGMLILWLQGDRSCDFTAQSAGALAPSGSGSMDWKDLNVERDFLECIKRTAERELFEESSIPARDKTHSVGRYTRVIGYGRNVRRGGKPEFVCVTYLTNVDDVGVCPNPDRDFEGEVRSLADVRTLVEGQEVDLLKNLRIGAEDFEENFNRLCCALDVKKLSFSLRLSLLVLQDALRSDSGVLESLVRMGAQDAT